MKGSTFSTGEITIVLSSYETLSTFAKETEEIPGCVCIVRYY